jgi:hypothetical protein
MHPALEGLTLGPRFQLSQALRADALHALVGLDQAVRGTMTPADQPLVDEW